MREVVRVREEVVPMVSDEVRDGVRAQNENVRGRAVRRVDDEEVTQDETQEEVRKGQAEMKTGVRDKGRKGIVGGGGV